MKPMKETTYNWSLYIDDPDVIDDLVEVLEVKNSVNNRTYLRSIMVNALVSSSKSGVFYLSTDNNNTLVPRYNPLMIGRRGLIKMVRLMVKEGYLVQQAGYSFQNGNSAVSKFTVTDKLVPYLMRCTTIRISPATEQVVCKVDGQMTDYRETEESMNTRKLLDQYNDMISDHSIEHEMDHVFTIMPKYLVRIISDDEHTLGGRYYAAWQNIRNGLRKYLTIDGSKIVELDYRSMNPSMLWALEGKSVFTEIGYPYDIKTVVHDVPKINKDAIKVLFACLVGTKRKCDAVNAAMNSLQDDDIEVQLEAMYEAADELLRLNQPIMKHLLQGKQKALQMQFLDSQVCASILQRMMDMDIVCLPIHDSFIVQREHEDTLRSVMVEEFQRHFNGITPEISKK
jgi:hypothetical protein